MALKTLQDKDLELVLVWRNLESVRQAMFTRHEITREEHYAWFEGLRRDPTRRCFLWFDSAGNPQGVVNFTNIDAKHGIAFWGFYANPTALMQTGVGTSIALDALNFSFDQLNLRKINAEVLQSNTRSLSFHRKIGFVEEGRFREQYFDGDIRIDVIRFGIFAAEWAKHRRLLQARPDTFK